jgi:hypothetical protein
MADMRRGVQHRFLGLLNYHRATTHECETPLGGQLGSGLKTVVGGIDETTAGDHDPAGAAPFDRFHCSRTGNGFSRHDLDRATRTFDESDAIVNVTDNPIRNQLRISLSIW